MAEAFKCWSCDVNRMRTSKGSAIIDDYGVEGKERCDGTCGSSVKYYSVKILKHNLVAKLLGTQALENCQKLSFCYFLEKDISTILPNMSQGVTVSREKVRSPSEDGLDYRKGGQMTLTVLGCGNQFVPHFYDVRCQFNCF